MVFKGLLTQVKNRREEICLLQVDKNPLIFEVVSSLLSFLLFRVQKSVVVCILHRLLILRYCAANTLLHVLCFFWSFFSEETNQFDEIKA